MSRYPDQNPGLPDIPGVMLVYDSSEEVHVWQAWKAPHEADREVALEEAHLEDGEEAHGGNGMRVNVYAEEMTEQVEIVEKNGFTGLRIYLHLPVTQADGTQLQGPFMHRPGDDDSSAVTFWGKKDLRAVLCKALKALDDHYARRKGLTQEDVDRIIRTVS